VQGELSREDRTKVITLITIDVHNRDVVQTLIDKRVESGLDFTWQSQLRYYWEQVGGRAGRYGEYRLAVHARGCAWAVVT
jgi:dynein heavy chain